MVIGGLVGAGVALLSAPQSGQETRAAIRQRGIELKDRAVEEINMGRARASELAASGKERLGEMVQRGQADSPEKTGIASLDESAQSVAADIEANM
jgi:gas vesicle protein